MSKKWIAGLATGLAIAGLMACSSRDDAEIWRAISLVTMNGLDHCNGEPETQVPCDHRRLAEFEAAAADLSANDAGTRALIATDSYQGVYEKNWGANKCAPASTTLDKLNCDSDAAILHTNRTAVYNQLTKLSQRP